MNATMLVLIVFVVLAGLEWRYQFRLLRVAATLLSLVVLFFAQPSSTRAARWAMFAPPAQRITELGSPLSEYESGVVTMQRAVQEDADMGADARLLALGAIFWFACTPLFVRPRRWSPVNKSSDSRKGIGRQPELVTDQSHR